jgi:acyl-CoA reductase-like NAD-dependent aldehyde dehydrogenase
MELANEVESGTVYMNRCDYLDPALAWNGWKNSGRGVSLSRFGEFSLMHLSGGGNFTDEFFFFFRRVGFDQLTRPKSYHIKRI